MQIRPIRTDADHEAALREIEALWGAVDGSETGNGMNIMIYCASRHVWPKRKLS